MRGCVILVEVDKPPRQTRKPKKLWLWWSGEGEVCLALFWKAYCRRFDLEHTIRFLKQTLGWTAPRFQTPRASRPVDVALVLVAYVQLRLARGIVADRSLPWERAQRPRRLTPTRLLRSFATLLATVGALQRSLRNPAGDPPDARRAASRDRPSVTSGAQNGRLSRLEEPRSSYVFVSQLFG